MKILKYFIFGFCCLYFLPGNSFGQLSTGTVSAVLPATQVLIGNLFSLNERDRINAALKLADYNHPQVIESLITVVTNDKNEMVRRVAVRSLGRIGSYQALPTILKSISSDKIGVKVEAMGAAVKFSTLAVINAIILECNSQNPIVRQNAVNYLGNLDNIDNNAINTIINKIKDISEGVRVAACKVAGERKIKGAVAVLSEIVMDDRSEVVRKYAVGALGNIKSQRSMEVLKNALCDLSPAVRIAAAASLAEMNSKAGMGETIEGIKSSDARVRMVACKIIGMIGDKNSKIFLQQAVNDFDRRVQRAAEDALIRLNNRIKEKSKG